MMTSRYPRELGIYVEAVRSADDFTTLAEVMKGEGYCTIGLTANPNINSTFNFQQGYHDYSDSGVLFSWMPYSAGKSIHGVAPLPSANELFEKAMSLVDQTGNQGPYFLMFDVMEVHEWCANRPGTNMLRPEYERLFEGGDEYVKYLRMLRQLTDDIGAFVDRLTALPGWKTRYLSLRATTAKAWGPPGA